MNEAETKTTRVQSSPLIEGVPASCCRCRAPLCLRKQVINLALGSETQMLCLSCLAADAHKDEPALMNSIKGYILGRECFRKHWERYGSRASCPDPQHCVIEECFAEG